MNNSSVTNDLSAILEILSTKYICDIQFNQLMNLCIKNALDIVVIDFEILTYICQWYKILRNEGLQINWFDLNKSIIFSLLFFTILVINIVRENV